MAARGPQPSLTIILVKPSASDAKGAPVPIMWTDCRAFVSSVRQRGYDFRRLRKLHRS